MSERPKVEPFTVAAREASGEAGALEVEIGRGARHILVMVTREGKVRSVEESQIGELPTVWATRRGQPDVPRAERDALVQQAVEHGWVHRSVEAERDPVGRPESSAKISAQAPSMESLIGAMLPDEPPVVPDVTQVLMARRNARARIQLLEEFGYLRAEEIAEGRSKAANRSALAGRWAKEGKIFSVAWGSRHQRLYPAFQFAADRSPLPAVAAVLEALPTEDMSEWEIALWWTAANGVLRGERPADVLLSEAPDALGRLAHAAERLSDESPL